jgi:hypothetical protein
MVDIAVRICHMVHSKNNKKWLSIAFCCIIVVVHCSKDFIEELDVMNISNTPGRSEHPAIAADSRGYFYVVWDERAPNGILDIYLAERPPAGDWTQPTHILEPQTPQREPNITADNENTLHVVGQYTNTEGWGEVLYTKKTLAGDWTTPEIIGMYGMACVPDVAVDDGGNVHIVWQELLSSQPHFYVKKVGSSWSTPVEISGENVFLREEPHIAIDPQGYAHVVWLEFQVDGDPENMIVYTTNAIGDTWSYPTVVAIDSLLAINSPTIEVTDDGTIHIVWSQDRDIFYTYKSSSDEQWNTPTKIYPTSSRSAGPCLTVDDDGTLHVVWIEGTGELYYVTKFKEGDWTEPKVYKTNTTIQSRYAAISPTSIGIVFMKFVEIDLVGGEDNYDIFFVELPKN